MKIGIDVDGVLTDFERFQLEKGKKYFGEVKDETAFEIEDIFGCTKKEADKFWLKNIFDYCLNYPMVDNAADIINLLQKEGNEIHIITRRVHTLRQDMLGKIFRTMLERFLKKNNINPDSINYCDVFEKPNNKLDICKKLNIDIMIEDDPKNIEVLSKDFKIICINTKYNKNINENANILRVDNFKNVYDAVNNFDKIKKEGQIKNLKFYKDNFEKSYAKARSIGVPLFKGILKPTIINEKNIPSEGPVLLCGNHLHVWDQFPIICATERTTHWMSKKEYFDSKLGPFFRKTGAICVDRYGDASKATDEALNYLKIGGVVGLFPEGTRNGLKEERIKDLYRYIDNQSYDSFKEDIKSLNPLASQVNLLENLYNQKKITKEEFVKALYDLENTLEQFKNRNIITEKQKEDSILLPFKYGAVSMAHKSGALIVPFGVTGDYKIGNDNLIVNIGEPFKVGDNLEEANIELRSKILNLVKENKQR